jgi:hypothetical protein
LLDYNECLAVAAMEDLFALWLLLQNSAPPGLSG